MPDACPASTPTRRIERLVHPCPREGGFTMVEILVVAVLILALVSAGAMSLRGTRDQSSATRARAVAQQLGEAIQQFQRDHGGRPPAQPGSVDWNANWTSPVDRANGSRPYAKGGSVEPLVDGSVALASNRGVTRPGPASRAGSRIHYFDDPARGRYALVVYVQRGTTWRAECFVSANQRADVASMIGSTGVTRAC